MEEKKKITAAGMQKMKDELEYLKNVRTKEIAADLKEARAQGDLSENAEYDAAKDEQAHVAARMEELEYLIKNTEVVTQGKGKPRKVNIGCTVKVLDMEFDEEVTFEIVGSSESNSLENKISNESPVGAALMGHKAGELAEVETEAGTFQYKVLDVQRTV